ncbi:MAG: oxygen-dependent coproporphyrinogen oxidase [Rhodobacteraceae bacterium]|nr:oxygen-dependent coproporphyrinogen oxidase [Paracoccaceae bacterium]
MADTAYQSKRDTARAWFSGLAASLRDRFERLEHEYQAESGTASEAPKFTCTTTRTKAPDGSDRGGGLMAVMRNGCLFEKIGINHSTVYGVLEEAALHRLAAGKSIRNLDRDPRFWASGVSLVAHAANPKVPAVHFNTRMFWTPVRHWFGGGADLTPCFECDADTEWFHHVLEACCARSDPGYYRQFKEWADRYFHIPHRNRARGVGGIFFDDLNSGDWEADFRFVTDVGRAFVKAYIPIVGRRADETYSESDHEKLLRMRALYAEFNLVYDRGTRFGLESGHDADAVLMSLPPVAKWP